MPELNLTQWDMLSLTLLTATVAGIVRGTTGFGGPAIMMLVLTQFYSPASVLVLVLMADYVANIQLAIGAARHAAWRLVIPLVVATFIGVPGGIYLLETAEPLLVKRGIAAITGVCAALLLTGWRFRGAPGLPAIALVGVFGGVVLGATFIALPIMIFIFSTPGNATTARANALTWGLVSSTILIAVFALRDHLSLNDLWEALLITLAYMVGAAMGSRVFKSLSEAMFRRVVLISLMALSFIGLLT